jgi:hypothetical protein
MKPLDDLSERVLKSMSALLAAIGKLLKPRGDIRRMGLLSGYHEVCGADVDADLFVLLLAVNEL